MAHFEVTPIRAEDRSPTIGALARAFYNDPMFNFFQPDLAKQHRLLTGFMRNALADSVPFGEVWVARRDDAIAAAAAWLPPGAWPRGWKRDLTSTLRYAPTFLSIWRRVPHALKLLNAVERAHIEEPHWYLALLGCDPSFQRTGAGRALLEPVIARADDEHLPVFIETQNEANLAYYARFGCEVVDKIELGRVPPIWTLLRDAR